MTRPNGILIQNTERQPRLAVRRAPISGPDKAETPQIALRLPCTLTRSIGE